MKKLVLFLASLFMANMATFAQIDTEQGNNSFAGADVLPVPALNSATISYSGDEDYFKVTVPRSSVLIAGIPLNSTGMGYWIRIYGDAPSYTLLHEDYNFSNQPVSLETLVPDGNYFISISQYSGANSSATPYTLNVSLDTTDPGELNQDFNTAYAISVDTTIQAKIRGYNKTHPAQYDEDYFKVTVPKSGVLIAGIPLNSTGIGYWIRIYGDAPSYTLLHEDYNFSNQPVSLETLVPAGNYFIKISQYSGANSSATLYTLNVNLDTNNSFLTASEINLCDTISAFTRGSTDTDYYAIPALTSGSHAVAYDVPSDIALTITAYDNAENIVGTAVSGIAGQSVTYSNLPVNTGYISVREVNNNGIISDYKLAITHSSCQQQPTEISHFLKSASFSIHPNPNNGRFIIKTAFAGNEPVQISVTDLFGRKVKEATTVSNGETSIALDASAGVYFVTVSTETAGHTEKIIVQ